MNSAQVTVRRPMGAGRMTDRLEDDWEVVVAAGSTEVGVWLVDRSDMPFGFRSSTGAAPCRPRRFVSGGWLLSVGREGLPYARGVAIDPAGLEPGVVVIPDEFSTLSDEDYQRVLTGWLAELDTAVGVAVAVTAADTLRELREHGER